MSEQTDEKIRDEVKSFLRRNFPMIQMHGGEAAIQEVNTENKSVTIQLGGTCSGCGISPLTTEAIKRELPKEIDGITTVNTVTQELGEMDTTTFKTDETEDVNAPF